MNTVSAAGVPTSPTTGTFCGHCGGTLNSGGLPAPDRHLGCGEQLALEPPRYCAACRRRMKVQVTPMGWLAECTRHGVLVP